MAGLTPEQRATQLAEYKAELKGRLTDLADDLIAKIDASTAERLSKLDDSTPEEVKAFIQHLAEGTKQQIRTILDEA